MTDTSTERARPAAEERSSAMDEFRPQIEQAVRGLVSAGRKPHEIRQLMDEVLDEVLNPDGSEDCLSPA